MLQEARTHHGRGGKRNKERNADRNTEDHGKFAEKAADDAGHHQNGDEHGNKGSAHGEHGETDFAGALYGCVKRLHAVFDVTSDVLDDDNGIVDDKAGTYGQSHERKIVQAIITEVHNAKSTNEGKRNGDARNNSGPGAAQECEHHKNNERYGDYQSDFDIVNGSSDGCASVDGDTQVEGGRDGGAEHRKDLVNAIDGLNHISGRLAKNGQEHGTLSTRQAQVASVRDGIDDFRNVP